MLLIPLYPYFLIPVSPDDPEIRLHLNSDDVKKMNVLI